MHFTGSPSLDQLRRKRLLTREQLERELGVAVGQKTVVVVYHPVTLLRDTTRESAALFSALSEVAAPLIFGYPNADAGSRKLIERTRKFVARRRNARIFVNLNHCVYLSLLKHSAVIVGNSSSGIIEAASLGLPVVNVGVRQKGRDHAANVLDVPASAPAIRKGLAQCTPSFRAAVQGIENPYGDGHAAEKIVKLLTTVSLGESLLFKKNILATQS